ncbi:MAG TPA: septum formation initiator family protein [Longimicrobiales bacterium]|nr:septum formation initiator family protein [Longimicrobiales bacterium]
MKLRIIFGVVLLVGAGYFAVFGGDYDVFDLRRVRQERALEEQRAKEVSSEVTALRARRDSLASDSATIERLARERYGLIRDGERLYRFADTAKDSLTGRAPE